MDDCCYKLNSRQRKYLPLKYALDFILSLLGLVIFFLPMCLIALIQKLIEPHEPVFFVHDRIGKDGKPFCIVKFRSMKSVVDHYLPTSEAPPAEECMTPFGRFLRDSSLDELPQLFQVLAGKMSLVGPRPLIPQEKEIHRMRWEYGVYQLRPGITGWAQINGRDHVKGSKKVELDYEYLKRIGFFTDASILWKTVKAVVRQENVE